MRPFKDLLPREERKLNPTTLFFYDLSAQKKKFILEEKLFIERRIKKLYWQDEKYYRCTVWYAKIMPTSQYFYLSIYSCSRVREKSNKKMNVTIFHCHDTKKRKRKWLRLKFEPPFCTISKNYITSLSKSPACHIVSKKFNDIFRINPIKNTGKNIHQTDFSMQNQLLWQNENEKKIGSISIINKILDTKSIKKRNTQWKCTTNNNWRMKKSTRVLICTFSANKLRKNTTKKYYEIILNVLKLSKFDKWLVESFWYENFFKSF